MSNLIELNEKSLKEENILAKAQDIIQKVESGKLCPLEIHLIAKAYALMSKKIIEATKSLALDEASNYSKNDQNLYGAKFTPKNTADTYNFEDDQEYKSLKEALKIREDELKDAYKSHQKGKSIVDQNGEIIPVVSLKKAGGMTLNVSFK